MFAWFQRLFGKSPEIKHASERPALRRGSSGSEVLDGLREAELSLATHNWKHLSEEEMSALRQKSGSRPYPSKNGHQTSTMVCLRCGFIMLNDGETQFFPRGCDEEIISGIMRG